MTPESEKVLADLLEIHTGQELSPERRWRISSALTGLLRELDIGSVDTLVKRLRSPGEQALATKVAEALLNHETYFFRDKAMFDLLGQKLLPELAASRASTRRLNIWSVGCSSGQEPLSLAMLFAEQPERWADWSIEILATDVSRSIVDTARKGVFSQFEIQRGLGVMQMLQWFEEGPNGWQAAERLRKLIRYKSHNLLSAAPVAARFDLILCRNVLLYFDGPTRRRAYDRLGDALARDGWLMLGAGETVVGHTDRLVPDASMSGFYRPADIVREKAPTRIARRAAS